MAVEHVENIRDLLVSVIGEELGRVRADNRLRTRYPNHTENEALVAWVLDGMTRHSLDLLMKLREAEQWR
jgi:hypothetical protein